MYAHHLQTPPKNNHGKKPSIETPITLFQF
jgi:hypothetical protein